jgi:predicted nicotinamide N-methyase
MSFLRGVSSAPASLVEKLSAEALYRNIAARYHVASIDLTVAGTLYKIFRVSDTNALLETIDPETFSHDERLPYWADLWASAIVLAEWCIQSGAVRGKNVLELGCGLGLAGIAAARGGAKVVMTDYEEDALQFARFNALTNVPEFVPTFTLMDWRAPEHGERYDFLLGSDIMYEQRHFLPLLDAFHTLLLPGGTVVLTDPDRAASQSFFALARAQGYSVRSSQSSIVYAGRAMSVTRYELRSLSDITTGRTERP